MRASHSHWNGQLVPKCQTDSDTDHDGLTDGAEGQHGTYPLHPDADQDGWPDGAEVAEELLLFLYSYQLKSDRPPSQQIGIPWERCAGLYRTNATTNMSFYGSLNRSASAIVHLKSDAPTWPKPKRSAVLSCSAWNMSDDPELASGATGSKITHGRSEQDRLQSLYCLG